MRESRSRADIAVRARQSCIGRGGRRRDALVPPRFVPCASLPSAMADARIRAEQKSLHLLAGAFLGKHGARSGLRSSQNRASCR